MNPQNRPCVSYLTRNIYDITSLSHQYQKRHSTITASLSLQYQPERIET